MTSSDDLMKELAEALRMAQTFITYTAHFGAERASMLTRIESALARYDASRPEGKSEASK